jgi:ABC-type lipoprotein export system ATPase subunit
MALLEVRNATKTYQTDGAPVVGVDRVSLTVHEGEFVALVGRSGCGKSTLLNLCGAIDVPTSGQVLIASQDTNTLTDAALTRLRREKVGFIFQSFQLLHTLTAAENVELPLMLARKAGGRSIALERLRWVGMEQYAHRLPHQLSGGQQQRVAIARALAHDPKLILADEPTGNLDTASGDAIVQLLAGLARDRGAAVVMATHSSEVFASADRVIRMRDGRVEADVMREAQVR